MRTSLAVCLIVLLSFTSCSKDDDNPDQSQYAYSDWLNAPKVRITNYAKGIKGHQSAAVYGDYAVFVTDHRSCIYIYNLKEKKYIGNIKMPYGSGTDYQGYTLYHSNQSSFGVEKYDEKDYFPLLYISQHAREDRRHFIEVFRIQCERDTELNELTAFKVSPVQTIYLPAMTNENALGNTNMAIDTLTHQMYVYSRNNNSGEENSGICKISCFDLPDASQQTVYLNDEDIKSSFYIDSSAANMQGGCVQDSILYIGRGRAGVNYIYLYAVDLRRQAIVAQIDLLKRNHRWEPEGCFFYEGCVMLSASGGIWKFEK